MEDIQEQVGNTFRKRIHTSFVLEFPCLQNTINAWKIYFNVVNGSELCRIRILTEHNVYENTQLFLY